MTKAQLVDFGCHFFEDTGNLRRDLEEMEKTQLIKLLFENNADAEPDFTPPPVEKKRGPASSKDLGSW